MLRAPTAKHFVAACEVLRDAGITCFEFTLTTEGAVEALVEARAALPDAVVGLGTVRTPQHLEAAAEVGAAFAVSQVFLPELVAAASTHQIPYVPGTLTPTEVASAWNTGVPAVKVSPIGPVGGVTYLTELLAPMPDVAIMPTGGVTLEAAARVPRCRGGCGRSEWCTVRRRPARRRPRCAETTCPATSFVGVTRYGPAKAAKKEGRLMKIGFIGLGIMGKPMAKNLLAAGHQVVVSSHNQTTAAELAAAGATVADTPKQIAEQVDLVITMLPNSPDVKAVALGADGIIEGAHTGLIFVDMSSIAPLVAREISDALADKGIAMLDAPVSGGEPKAIDGTLSVMVGGDEQVFDKVKDVLSAMAASVVYVGEIGAGNIAKLANQVIVALNIAAVSEALVLAGKAGVSPDAVFAAIRGGLAGSTVLEAKAPMMMDHNFKPGFRIKLHMKDLVNALDTSHGVGASLPLTASVLEMLTALEAAGHGGDDHSGLVQYYETLAKTSVETDRARRESP